MLPEERTGWLVWPVRKRPLPTALPMSWLRAVSNNRNSGLREKTSMYLSWTIVANKYYNTVEGLGEGVSVN